MNLEQKNHEIGEEEKIFTGKERERIAQRTKELIEKVIEQDIQVIFFMDRSARPIYWFMKEAWQTYAQGHRIPDIKFINIGREKGDLLEWRDPPNAYFDGKSEVDQYWKPLENTNEALDNYLVKMKKELENIKSESDGFPVHCLIVDDYSVSGFSSRIANAFFERHFKNIAEFSNHIFFDQEDEAVFSKVDWNGVHMPWNSDKSYTHLSNEDDPRNITAKPERDPEKIKNALKLRKEAHDIFFGV